MHLGWLQGELALEPLRPLPCTPRLDSSFRKLGLTHPPPPPPKLWPRGWMLHKKLASTHGVGEACR